MIIFPYPASKKEVKEFKKSFSLFFKIFPRLFLYTDIGVILLVNIFLSLFVQEFKKRSIIEFLGFFVGLQFYFIFPIILVSLFLAIIYIVTRKK